MFQFSLAQIKNGFLVQHPDFVAMGKIVSPEQMQQPPQAIVHFCSDFAEVIDYMKKIWPAYITNK